MGNALGNVVAEFAEPRYTAPAEIYGMAALGLKSMNFAPSTFRIENKFKTLAATSYTPEIDVAGAKKVWLRYSFLSNTNPRPAEVHNCETSVNIVYKFDVDDSWSHGTAQCGANVNDKVSSIWQSTMLPIPVPIAAKSMKLAMAFVAQHYPDPKPEIPMFLIDDALIFLEDR